MRIGILCSRVRVEEKLLFDAFEDLGVSVTRLDEREIAARVGEYAPEVDVVLERSISTSAGLVASLLLESAGVRVINSYATASVCADKIRTTLALEAAGVPQPRTEIALSPEAALEAVERIGYPAVLKPPIGSWGRLLARVNDRDAAEAVIEHQGGARRDQPPHLHSGICRKAAARYSRVRRRHADDLCHLSCFVPLDHQHSARRAGVELPGHAGHRRSVPPAALAVSGGEGGLLAIDLFEDPQRGLLVNEVNHTMEFRNSIVTTGVNIPEHIARLMFQVAEVPI
jgi:[lysine-biosynthesis-protein LysW]--L-2-aminoadipate ligase